MSAPLKLYVKRLSHSHGLELPRHQTEQSAGLDLAAAINDDYILKPMQRALIPTGLKLALPEGYEAQIRPRSGLAVKYGLTLINSPGTIDADYRGEIKIPLINLGAESFTLKRGERIAQMIIAPYQKALCCEVSELSQTTRDEAGFGSTGKRA